MAQGTELRCRRCGQVVPEGSAYCGRCGAAQMAPGYYAYGPGDRDWLVALLLSCFLGTLGIDRFYLGKIGTGILKLLTFGGFGIWWLIDVILIATDSTTDAYGHRLVHRYA